MIRRRVQWAPAQRLQQHPATIGTTLLRTIYIHGNHLLFTDGEIGELGTLEDGLISIKSPAVFTPLSSIRRYRDDRSSLPPLPFFVARFLVSRSASLIRLALRSPASENMLIDGRALLPSFVIFCNPVR